MHLCLSTFGSWLALSISAAAVAAPETRPALSVPPLASAAPRRLRPVPEFAPVGAVLLSEDLLAYDYHAPELLDAVVEAGAEAWVATNESRPRAAFLATLTRLGTSAAARRGATARLLPHGNIWMRDYGPLPLATAAGELRFAALRYADPSSAANDGFPRVAGRALAVPVDQLPVVLDGGNFLTDGETCFTSAADLPKSRESKSPGGAAALLRYGSRVGCRTTVLLRDPPHAHLDMWVKIVGPKSALVNELDERAIAAAKSYYGHVPPEITELRDALNKQADELSRYLTVRRLPMPLPYRGAFRTFANALLVNGHAVVPSYARFGWGYDDYPDSALEPYYEAQAAAAYRASGFTVRFINADGLIYNGGAFHCVTAQIPDLHPQQAPKGQ